jgi:hypothetical protein
MADKKTDDLVDAGSEYSFPASDPPSYMGGIAVAGSPPRGRERAREPVSSELTNPDGARPPTRAARGTDPTRTGDAPGQPGSGQDRARRA